jgi:methylated-DNA-[protein]-cysteine S-methyltransferase
MPWTIYESPLGPLTLIAGPNGLRRVGFAGRGPSVAPADHDPGALAAVVAQLDGYFAGERRTFQLRLDLSGTAFQERVWRAVQELPYGRTTTYGALARALGVTPSGAVSPARTVAAAVAATPTPIVVPCHRVIAADGSLTGYLGGLERKQALLDFEAAGGAPEALARPRPQQLALL